MHQRSLKDRKGNLRKSILHLADNSDLTLDKTFEGEVEAL
jgi:hypothetical protein